MENVGSKYKSAPGSNKGFILDHSTGNKPANSEIDAPINYADERRTPSQKQTPGSLRL